MQIQRLIERAGMTGAALVAVLFAGCSTASDTRTTTAPRVAGSASRRIENADAVIARPVIERVFREHFRIDSAASGAGVLVAQPQEISGQMKSERIRDVVGGTRGRFRHLAELRISQQGPDIVLRCVVQTQRLETSERAAFSGQRGEDRPTETPIDRIGATSADNREEWVAVKRDRELEQEILTAIAEALQPATKPAK